MNEKKRLTDFASCAGCAAKVAAGGISAILKHLPVSDDPNLLVGTATHDDAGIYMISPDLAMVQTVDFFPPTVDDPFVYGQVAAANALSDVYAMGGTPKTALNLFAFPEKEADPDWLGAILDGGADRMRAARCIVLGGHSVRDAEIKFGYAVTGFVHPERFLTNAGAKPGDLLVLTKPLGTGFVTTAAKKLQCPAETLAAACASMVALNEETSRQALEAGAHAMTDVTGFGLAGHGLEMADGSGVTLRLRLASLPAFPGVEDLIRNKFQTRASTSNRAYVNDSLRFESDPDPIRAELLFDAQTSGGLLIAVPAGRERQIDGVVIGDVLPKGDVSLLIT
ncbi:MAG: selenide, water dikinase SelD [Gemmataceae bacterium]|nr:selenide, water dikinase SelD [Gemmataceae bacterium]